MKDTPFAGETSILRALAHPGRLEILHHLRRGSACVCHLTAALGRPQAYVSQQVAILRAAGIIEGRKDGAFIYYRLRDHAVLGITDLASRLVDRPQITSLSVPQRLAGCDCPQCARHPAPAERT